MCLPCLDFQKKPLDKQNNNWSNMPFQTELASFGLGRSLFMALVDWCGMGRMSRWTPTYWRVWSIGRFLFFAYHMILTHLKYRDASEKIWGDRCPCLCRLTPSLRLSHVWFSSVRPMSSSAKNQASG